MQITKDICIVALEKYLNLFRNMIRWIRVTLAEKHLLIVQAQDMFLRKDRES